MQELIAELKTHGVQFSSLYYTGTPPRFKASLMSLTEKIGDWPKYYHAEHGWDPIVAIRNAIPKKEIDDFKDLA